uniref:Uncharacterized protein n=1 Tax=Anguilla anguilla TaxID=7936 RepID=A0A0E9W928_ANGAN
MMQVLASSANSTSNIHYFFLNWFFLQSWVKLGLHTELNRCQIKPFPMSMFPVIFFIFDPILFFKA